MHHLRILGVIISLAGLNCFPALGQNPARVKPTLIIFSGSDWCLPCIRLEKTVFSTDTFQSYSARHLQVIRADFPQRSTLPDSLVGYNEVLAERYNPEGLFPRVCLLKPGGADFEVLRTSFKDAEGFIAHLDELLPKAEIFRRKALLMGSAFEFSLVAEDEDRARRMLDLCIAETQRLEALLSEWQSGSEVSEVNRMAGSGAVKVSEEFYELTKRSLQISSLTQGAFDISFRGVSLWDFKGEELEDWPDSALIERQLSTVGYERIRLMGSDSIFLTDSNMAIGFGAIGKGYVADHLRKILLDSGITAGVINASGDLTTWGYRPDGTEWKVGISNPNLPENISFGLPLSNRCIATSGSYEKYFTFEGVRYAHIIDPRTGIPVSDKKSVSVISKSAELSDALATAFFVLDTEIALDLAEQLPGVSCIIIDKNDQVFTSADIRLNQ